MDVSSNRLFRFSKPEWLNNSAVRNTGVYISGALVSSPCTPQPPEITQVSRKTPSQVNIPIRSSS